MLKRLCTCVTLIFVGLLIILPNQSLAEESFKIYVSVYPLYDVTKSIVGDKAQVELVTPHGADAHTYEPSPRRAAQIEGGDLFLYIGLGMDPWSDKIIGNLQEAGVKTIRTSQVATLLKHENNNDHHSHNSHDNHHNDHEHTHYHGEYDPHIWLDPMNMIEIAKLIKVEAIYMDKANTDYYRDNFADYVIKALELDRTYRHILANRKHNYILTSHAAFGYLAKRYGLIELSVASISPHAEPSLHALSRLTREVKEHGIEYIFLETLASPRTAHVLAEEANLKILTLNPLEGLTEKEQRDGKDYFTIMLDNLESLRKALVE